MSKRLFVLIFTFMVGNISFGQDFEFFEPSTKVGGYGELHYNYKKSGSDPSKETLDFHRFVLFISHNFSEKWSFKSEVELEHNFVGDGDGELELEQAYVNYHHADYLGIQAGVILNSAGFINEYHEPPLFFGVERPEYAKYIIPTTWFGNGAALYGSNSGFDYKITVMEGLNSDEFNTSSGIRSGRRKGFKSDAKNLLYNGRVDYTGLPGFRIGVSYTYNKANGDSTENKIGLAEFHARYQNYGVYLVVEAGNISYDSGDIESSRGFYFDIGYNIGKLLNVQSKIIPFFRYSDINTAASTKSGGVSELKDHNTQWMFGFSYLPIDQVVFKVDYSEVTNELSSVKTKMFNLGAGYMF